MEEEKKVLNEKETKEMVKQEKKNKREGRTLFGKIVNILLWIIVLAWMAMCVIDFLKFSGYQKDADDSFYSNVMQDGKIDLMFCLKRDVIEYDDGKVITCTGPGYKAYVYNRKCYQALQFGPFWTKDASKDFKECK